MKTQRKLMAVLLALAVQAPFTATTALAQGTYGGQSAYTMSQNTVRIDGFDVAPVMQAVPGRELQFTLYGTPGGSARVEMTGATGSVLLEETEPGMYEGVYTLRQRDRITAASKATVNLRVGNQVATTVLDEPLVGPNRVTVVRPGVANGSLRIDRIELDPPYALTTGSRLGFTLRGTPRADASVRIQGVRGKVVLQETQPGVYQGSYDIKNRDRIENNASITGVLRVGNKQTTAVLSQGSLVSGTPASNAPARQAQYCAVCGVVEAINVVEVNGDGSYLGKIAGGVAGVVLGSQVGGGSGRTAAQVLGALGGAYAGNEIEKRVRKEKHFEVVVRLEGGTTQTVSYAADPGLTVGTRVRVENGNLTRR
ncbi:MAG: glycine zipper 2TM domain-containing protein [Burkholderiaceae bacterium]|nr:glycine zipper 2TM domain-containing protein [Burkholderiaceae bacterium]